MRTPGLSAALLATIALGIGSNAAVLGFIRGAVVHSERPLSVIDRVVAVFGRDARSGFHPVSFDRYTAIQTRAAEFELLGAARETDVSASMDGRIWILSAARITPQLAALLEISPGAGAVASERFWRTELRAGTEAPAAATIRIDDADTPITGVAPAWLDGLFAGRSVDLWLPLDESTLDDSQRRSRTFWVFGRLRADVSLDRAQASVVAAGNDDALVLLPYTGIGPEAAAGFSQLAGLLPGAAALVFFIACANVVAFLLSRATARSQETSVRVALGAGRPQLLKALLADSMLIAVTGGAAGALLAVWTTDVIPALFFDQDAEHLRFVPDVSSVVKTAIVCGALVTVCGLVPLVDLRHDQPAAVLRREGAGPSLAVRRLRAGLVIAQMASCLVLAISTGLLLNGVRAALRTSAGHRTGQPIVATLEWRGGAEFLRTTEKAALAVPGVLDAEWAAALPGGRPQWQEVRIEPPGLPKRDVDLHVASFTPESVEEFDLPPLAGRLFGGRDGPSSCRVVVVNDIAARLMFDGDAVGRRIEDPAGDSVEIVGVVVRRPRGTEAIPPTIYYYAEQPAPPFDREGPATFRVPVLPAASAHAVLDTNGVSAGFFDAMGFSLLDGNLLTAAPPERGCSIAVVNQEAAELHFGGRAVGAAVIDDLGRRTAIVGVVHAPQLRTSQRAVEPTMYFPMSHVPRVTLILSARDATDEMLVAVRRALGVSDDASAVTTLEDRLARTGLAAERIATVLIGAAAALAIGLAMLGVYGAMADAVARRRREFALRIALGAQRWRIIGQVVADGLRLAAAGAGAGILGSVAATYWLARLSPAAGALDVRTALLGSLGVVGLVLAACVLPARRALAADPLAMMRDH